MIKSNIQNPNSNSDKLDDYSVIKDIIIKKTGAYFGFCIKGGKNRPLGITVTNVDKNSAADLCGLSSNDIILSINNVDFTQLTIQEAIDYLLSINIAFIKVRRKLPEPELDDNIKLSPMVAEKPIIKEITNETSEKLKHIQVARSNLEQSFGFTIHCDDKLLITSIQNNSPAYKSKLNVGDEIVQVNDKAIITLEDFYECIQIFKNALILKLIVKSASENLSDTTLPSSSSTISVTNSSLTSENSLKNDKNKTMNSNNNNDKKLSIKKRLSKTKLETLINQLSDLDCSSDSDNNRRFKNRRKTPDIYEKIIKTNANKNTIITPPNYANLEFQYRRKSPHGGNLPILTNRLNRHLSDTVRAKYRFELPSKRSHSNKALKSEPSISDKSQSLSNLANSKTSTKSSNNGGYISDQETEDDDYFIKKKFKEKANDWNPAFVNSTNEWNQSSNELEENTVFKLIRRETSKTIRDKQKYFSSYTKHVKKEETTEKHEFFINAMKNNDLCSISADSIGMENSTDEQLNSGIELKIKNLRLNNDEKKSSKQKPKSDNSIKLLPLNSEIWLPGDDSVLNIETESIIPECPLSSKIVTSYEYPLLPDQSGEFNETIINSTDNNDRIIINNADHDDNYDDNDACNNSLVDYVKYRSKLIKEYTPNGFNVVRINKQADWPEIFGLKFDMVENEMDNINKHKLFEIKALEENSASARLTLFQTGMMLEKLNDIELDKISNSLELENIIEDIYKNNRKMEFHLRSKSSN